MGLYCNNVSCIIILQNAFFIHENEIRVEEHVQLTGKWCIQINGHFNMDFVQHCDWFYHCVHYEKTVPSWWHGHENGRIHPFGLSRNDKNGHEWNMLWSEDWFHIPIFRTQSTLLKGKDNIILSTKERIVNCHHDVKILPWLIEETYILINVI